MTKKTRFIHLLRLTATLVGLAMLALPAVASADDGDEFEFEGPLETTSVEIPLLGSPLTIDVTVGTDGSIESVSFTPDPGFAQVGDDEGDFTFVFQGDGFTYEVEIEAEDGTLKIEFEIDDDEGDDDEGNDDEGDDDEGDDDEGDDDEGDEGDDDEGDDDEGDDDEGDDD
ncbi:MAG: hypothetical protein Q8Q29_04975 [Actinomycetota bacterium]|nr:hypothetical protein [Actinomycetota bacterium]